MPPNLTNGAFEIVSLVDGNPPVGVDHTKPAFQFVRLNGPARVWRVREEGPNIYRLSVGGYSYTGIENEKVIASIHPEQNVEWRAIYRPLHDAYTIEPVHDAARGWTVPHGSGPDSNAVIQIELIIVLPVEPVRIGAVHLFRFTPVYE